MPTCREPVNRLKRAMLRLRGVLPVVAAGILWSVSTAAAQDFYKGKTLSIVVGYAVGGGYDQYARLLARHMERYIPGNPNIVVVNMPGAATLTALRHMDTTAAKDGTVVVLFDFFQIGNSLLAPEKVNIDFRKYQWIGSISEDLSVCYIWHTIPANSVEDLRKGQQIHMGLTAAGTMNEVRQKILKNMLGLNIRTVSGYKGSAEEKLAMERGELEGGCGGWSSVPPDWRRDGKVKTIVKLVPARAPDMPPNVPYVVDLVSSNRDKQIIELLTQPAQLGKPIIASAAVPAERIQALQQAFDQTVKDPQFLAEAEKMQLEVSPKSAAEAIRILDEIYSLPADIVQEAKRVMSN
jgi:tripartite-type tricarboxylate transporter receptor subunit TctC